MTGFVLFASRSGIKTLFDRAGEVVSIQHTSTVRYRRPIEFLMTFVIKTRMVYFDERSIYFEHKFVSLHDGFIRAIVLSKNTSKMNVPDVMKELGLSSPLDCPEELELFIRGHEISSEKLLKEANMIQEAKVKATM